MRSLLAGSLFALLLGCAQPPSEADPAPDANAGGASIQASEQQIEVSLDGKPFTTFYIGPDEPKPYLHPLRAADGAVVTRSYPMSDQTPGEAHDHPHHRGLWFTHGDVNGFDFWGNEPSYDKDNLGKVVLKKVHQAEGDTIRSEFDWLDPAGAVLLTEDRTMRFQSEAGNNLIDFDATFTAGSESVKFGDTKEGMFAVRLAATMRELTPDKQPGDGVIVNAEGATGAENTWGKASPWVDYSGPVDGKTYGVAIFDHPENPKHPGYWHVRNYGLFAANIFGEHDFFDDDSRDGSMTLEPGQSLRLRYRVVIHPGDAEAAGVAALYQQYR